MKYVSLLLILISFNTLATKQESLSCISKLTYDLNVDSRAFKINTDEMDTVEDDMDQIAQAIAIIKITLDLAGCNSEADINFGKTPTGRSKHSCSELSAGKDYSTSCYVETDIGYFFVTKDLQTNAFVVYSRWD